MASAGLKVRRTRLHQGSAVLCSRMFLPQWLIVCATGEAHRGFCRGRRGAFGDPGRAPAVAAPGAADHRGIDLHRVSRGFHRLRPVNDPRGGTYVIT